MLNKRTLQEQKQGFDSYIHQLQNWECYTAALLVGPQFWWNCNEEETMKGSLNYSASDPCVKGVKKLRDRKIFE